VAINRAFYLHVRWFDEGGCGGGILCGIRVRLVPFILESHWLGTKIALSKSSNIIFLVQTGGELTLIGSRMWFLSFLYLGLTQIPAAYPEHYAWLYAAVSGRSSEAVTAVFAFAAESPMFGRWQSFFDGTARELLRPHGFEFFQG